MVNNTLWCLGEEQISYEIINLYKWVCNIHGSDIEIVDEIKYIKHEKTIEITGLKSSRYNKFIYCIVQRDGNGFVDYLFYEGNDKPKENGKPIAVAEATKNTGNEAGNMTSQRSSKKISVIEKWGDIPFAYLITNFQTIENCYESFTHTHKCDFATMQNFGHSDIIISEIGKLGYKKFENDFKYDSISEIIKRESQKRLSRGVPSRVKLEDGKILIQCNLFKKKGNHDPGEGYVASRSYLVRKLDSNIEIVLVDHGRDKKFFEKSNNKLINVLKTVGVTIKLKNGESFIIKKDENVYNKSYWKFANTGEKMASIFMENEFRNKGYEVLFTNHAGCGKSYINIFDKYYTSKQGKGIPDIVFYKKETNELLVIEGETTENYKKGIKQVLDKKFDDFIQREFISRLPNNTSVKKYLCTFGDYNNEPEVLFNLDKDFKINLNEQATPIK